MSRVSKYKHRTKRKLCIRKHHSYLTLAVRSIRLLKKTDKSQFNSYPPPERKKKKNIFLSHFSSFSLKRESSIIAVGSISRAAV